MRWAHWDEVNHADTTLRDKIAMVKPCHQNMLRDINRQLPTNRLPELQFHRIPTRHKLGGIGYPQLPFMWPHALFAAIYHHYPGAWAQVIAPIGEVERFWEEVEGGTGQTKYDRAYF